MRLTPDARKTSRICSVPTPTKHGGSRRSTACGPRRRTTSGDRAGFGPGARLLDVGCGPGFAALDLAGRVGAGGRVLAVDESARFIETLAQEASRRGLDQLTARVERVETLRLDPASLDGAFARWLFCFLPDPAPVIERVVSGLRPGGCLVVWDYLNYRATALQPPSAALERVLAAVDESWRRTGGDLNVGGRLPGLIASAGTSRATAKPIGRGGRLCNTSGSGCNPRRER